MKKMIITALVGLLVAGCAGNTHTQVSRLYTGYEQGTWYKFSPRSCSATLCPAF